LQNHFCSNDKGNYTTTNSYRTNLNHLLSSLPSTNGNGFGFYNSSYGGNTTSDAIYAIGMCKGDINNTTCLQCLNASRSALMEPCPIQKEAIIWYDSCMLCYSNRSIYGVTETILAFNLWSTRSVPSSKFDVFFGNLTILLQRLRTEAAAIQDFLSGSSEELPNCCDGKEGGRVLRPSCNFNYQLNNTTNPRDAAQTWLLRQLMDIHLLNLTSTVLVC
uniref:cysteine-rich repeat secretory protein 38-like n=1 Tax=Fragaria vesca subsp. vesca TaxID=101020 RepID=UPI0005C80D3B